MSNSKSDNASQGLFPSQVKLKCRWIIFVSKNKDDKKQSSRIQATFIIKSWQSKGGKQPKLSVSMCRTQKTKSKQQLKVEYPKKSREKFNAFKVNSVHPTPPSYIKSSKIVHLILILCSIRKRTFQVKE